MEICRVNFSLCVHTISLGFVPIINLLCAIALFGIRGFWELRVPLNSSGTRESSLSVAFRFAM